MTGFQVDIEIYIDKLSQSGDRILSSHITIDYIVISRKLSNFYAKNVAKKLQYHFDFKFAAFNTMPTRVVCL